MAVEDNAGADSNVALDALLNRFEREMEEGRRDTGRLNYLLHDYPYPHLTGQLLTRADIDKAIASNVGAAIVPVYEIASAVWDVARSD